MHEEDILEFEGYPLTIGDTVPDIAFEVYHNDAITETTLKQFRGKWLILFFYPADFTFVCPTELGELASCYDEFKKEDTEIVSVSIDTPFAHKMWHQTSDTIKQVQFPMAADNRHLLSNVFGTYCDHDGVSYRATFIIDPDGIIRSFEINDNSIGRSAKELLRKLRAARYVSANPGQVCPASWEAGKKTLKPSDDLVGAL